MIGARQLERSGLRAPRVRHDPLVVGGVSPIATLFIGLPAKNQRGLRLQGSNGSNALNAKKKLRETAELSEVVLTTVIDG
jgi:hypothetical protein